MSLYDSLRQGGSSPSNPSTGDSGNARQQFVEHIKIQAYDDNFIDRQEERNLLERAVGMGLGADEAMAVIREVAEDKGFVVERDLEDRATERLAQAASDKKGLEKKEFDEVLSQFIAEGKNTLRRGEAAKRLKAIVLAQGFKVKEGGVFGSKWFSDIG